MGMTKRHALKRSMAQANHNLDRALANIQAVHTQFSGVHDDYAEYLEKIAQAMIFTQALIKKFWQLAWGKWPEDMDAWRG